MSVWTRPDGEYPRIWLQENGIVIRDVTPDIESYVIQHMLKHFGSDEPLNKTLGLSSDPEGLADLEKLWRESFLPQKVCIVALAEGEPGADLRPVSPSNPPRVIGANMIMVVHKNDRPTPPLTDTCKSKVLQRVLGTVYQIASLDDVFARYGVDHYMDAAGLSVCPKVRGKGLGLMLLRARIEVCKHFGVPLSKTVFTNVASQKIAEKAGFELVAEKNCQDIVDKDGVKYLANMDPSNKTLQLRARRIP